LEENEEMKEEIGEDIYKTSFKGTGVEGIK